MVRCENKDIVWYNSVDYIKRNVASLGDAPGFQNFKYVHKIWATNLSLTDRSGILKFPVKTVVPDYLKIPTYVRSTHTLEDACVQRATKLMDHAKNTNRKICIMYSGGIDSSLIVASFILACSVEDLKKYVIVALSENSIRENPVLYKEHILRCMTPVTSSNFPYYIGNDKFIMVSGEGNDQLFGAVYMKKLIKKYGNEIIHKPYTEGVIVDCFDHALEDRRVSELFWKVFSKLVKSAPIELQSVYHFYWWINFTTKFQNTYIRNIAFVRDENRLTIKPEENYTSFFADQMIQLWVMNNQDLLIRDTWLTYKYPCKEIIYKVTKDKNYLDRKSKYGSFSDVNKQVSMGTSITTDYQVTNDHLTKYYWNQDNEFV